jgi:hypothetical protein
VSAFVGGSNLPAFRLVGAPLLNGLILVTRIFPQYKLKLFE